LAALARLVAMSDDELRHVADGIAALAGLDRFQPTLVKRALTPSKSRASRVNAACFASMA